MGCATSRETSEPKRGVDNDAAATDLDSHPPADAAAPDPGELRIDDVDADSSPSTSKSGGGGGPVIRTTKAADALAARRREERDREQAEKAHHRPLGTIARGAVAPVVRMTKAAEALAAARREEREREEQGYSKAMVSLRLVAPTIKGRSGASLAARPAQKPELLGAASPSRANPLASTSTIKAGLDDGSPPVLSLTESDLAGWRMQRRLGKGSFGATYEASLRSNKVVAVKVIEFGDVATPSDMAALRNEIALMKRMSHRNIVQYYGCTEDLSKRTINIFMELVTGGSLDSVIEKRGKIEFDKAQEWTRQICCGVKYLHDSSIIHRDIKGANILVTGGGACETMKLADFGCSKSIDDACSKTHGCQTMVGTPFWMAPEVLKSEPYGTKSDVWSIGCTVCEMITGEPPWPPQDNMWAAVYKIANSKGVPPGVPKDLPPVMMDFLMRCFERDPSKRASVDELLAHAWLSGVPAS